MKEITKEIKREVVSRIDLYKDYGDEEILEVIDEIILHKSKTLYISISDKRQIKRSIFNSIRRYDILQDLIEDPTITEIMINGSDRIFIEQDGRIRRWSKNLNQIKS